MTARILIVDDVPANTRLLAAKLSAEYYQVKTARDGFEALTSAKVIAHPTGALSERKWQEHHWAPSVRLEADWPCGQACVRGD
jgi:response regulator RpfG family c-di-GMP phosphodiesterase